MSVRAVGRVWESSAAKGCELLVLLAIADWTDDEGRNAWGNIEKLAEKSRLSDRAVRNVLARLVERGELAIERNEDGRKVLNGHRPRRFMHVLCARKPEQSAGSQPAESAGSTGTKCRPNRQNVPVQPAEYAGSVSGSTGTLTYDEPAHSRTRIKEDPSGSVKEHTPRAREDARRPHPLDEPPVSLPASVRQFDELWAIYPRQDRRVAAVQAWALLAPSAELGAFIVAHVRMRLAAGWQKATPERFIPLLCNFLAERRWKEREAPPSSSVTSPPVSAARSGMLTMRSCPVCGSAQEGVVIATGESVYPPCLPCAQAGDEALDERGKALPS